MRFNGSGIAAVVGPNGCGKSNLSDAISWVLGEQSAKSLRGARMEDVIFAGTRDRKPLGLAAVTMTLVNPRAHEDVPASTGNGNGSAAPAEAKSRSPLDSEEITVTRRLFRNGESEYLVNGKLARLRDIQDIFMGTGLGPESYAIIEQGRIGQILSNRPQDRRAIIEEAAGVTKFKTRRRLAEAKLESAKQNLTRVFDILEEVSRQVNSLKRQASKARRYEELKTQAVEALRKSLVGRFRAIERDTAKIALDLNAASAEAQSLTQSVAEKDKEQSRLREQLYRTENQLTDARKRVADLRLEDERARGRLEYQAKQIGSIEQRLAQGETETQDLEARTAKLQAEVEAHSKGVAELERHTETARARLVAKNEERERLQSQLREREQAIEAGRQGVLRLLGEAAALRNQLAQIEEYLAGIERNRERARKDEQQASSDLEWIDATGKELSAKIEVRREELAKVTLQRKQVEELLAARKTEAGQTRRGLDELRAEASRIKARRDSLDEILSHRAYTTESVKRLFTAIEQGQAAELKAVGVLADFVEVDPAYEKATEEFLHDELEYVVVDNWAQAERGIDLMRTDMEGRATFLVHPDGDLRNGRPHPEDPAIGPETGIVGRLRDRLRFTNGLTRTPAEILPRLARCFVVEDRAAAQRLALEYPDVYFLLADGVCYHGHAVTGGRKSTSGPLALKRELRELKVLSDAKLKEVDATAGRLAQLESEIGLAETELERLRVEQQDHEKQAVALDHERRKLNEELDRASSRLKIAKSELARLDEESRRSDEQRERSQRVVEEKEQARRAQEEALSAARAEIEKMQADVARAGEEHSALRAELAGLDERRRAEKAAQARLEAQWKEVSNRKREITAEMERLGVERARLLADNIELDRRAGALIEEIAGIETTVDRLAEAEAGEREKLAAIEESLKQLRLDVQTAHEKRSQIEVELVKRQAELKYLEEISRKELNAPIAELAAQEETIPDEQAMAEAEQAYQEVMARIEALGPVNPQALEEFKEAQQRYDFLNTQRQDLIDSIRDTEKAIHDIDIETRKRFIDAYERINTYFREMFQVLFGGGNGEMRLTDETNIAESGIDIVASPPGKRLQNVLLLSGGEKALTALALLMAVFRFQPSPFCILDEVDAPLDEPNIMRLTRLLKEMASQTQFIVITHAKRTMEAAEALYGVTMQEPGVSKLVSVRFQEPPPAALEAQAGGNAVRV
jgi:chromosome segregation protein